MRQSKHETFYAKKLEYKTGELVACFAEE